MRNLGLILAIILAILIPVSLFAQNIPFNPNKDISTFNHDLGKLQAFSLAPNDLTSQTLIEYGKAILSFDIPVYSLLKNKDLIYNYMQDLKTGQDKIINNSKGFPVNRTVFNALYNKPKIDEKKLIRLAWKKVFGLDVWYPYYKAKEIEDWVKDRMAVRVFGLKGNPTFENNQIVYIFKRKF